MEGGWGFLTSKLRDVHRDLLGFQAETDERFDKVEQRLDRLDGRLDRVEHEVKSLRDNLPGIVCDAMPEAIRETRA